MDEIRQRQFARGYQGRSVQEMQAEEAARRQEEDDYEQRMHALESQPGSGSSKGNP
jgi:hypothetical protein